MTDRELLWDKRLQIRTAGRDEQNADQYRFPYEPTPYSVLERLAGSGLIGKQDVVLDYGCGKGRVGFFLSAQTQATSIGVEYDERIYRQALETGRRRFPKPKPTSFWRGRKPIRCRRRSIGATFSTLFPQRSFIK